MQVRATRYAHDASFRGALVVIWGLGRRASCSCPARQGRTGHRSWKELAALVDRACHKSWLDPSGNLGLEKQRATELSGTRVTFDFNFALALLKNSSEKTVRSMKDAFKGMQTCSSSGPFHLRKRPFLASTWIRGLTGQSHPESKRQFKNKLLSVRKTSPRMRAAAWLRKPRVPA